MFKKVLYPVDVQEGYFSTKEITGILEQVRQWKAELYLVYVIPGFSTALVASYFPPDAEKKMLATADKNLSEFIKAHVPKDIKVHPYVRQGTPYREILEIARAENVDLIVMPSHDRKGAEKWLLGSTAEKVVTHSHRSVLVLRHLMEG